MIKMTYSNYSPIEFKLEQAEEVYEYIENSGGKLFACYDQEINEVYFLPEKNSVIKMDLRKNHEGSLNKLVVGVMSEKIEDLSELVRDLKKINS